MVKLELDSIREHLDLVSPGRRQSARRQGEGRNVLPMDARGSASRASPASRGTSPVSPTAASLLISFGWILKALIHWHTTSAWPERDMEAKGSSCLEMESGKGCQVRGTPLESQVSTSENQQQAHRTSESMGMTSRDTRACQTEEGIDIGIHLRVWVLAVSTKSLSRVLALLSRVTTLQCHLLDTRKSK